MLPPKWPVASRKVAKHYLADKHWANALRVPSVVSVGSVRLVDATGRVTVTPCQSVKGTAEKMIAEAARLRRTANRTPGKRTPPAARYPAASRGMRAIEAPRTAGRPGARS